MERGRIVWRLALRERATPREIAQAVALGAFCGASPALMVRPWIAVALATAIRRNRLFAFLGSHLSGNFVLTPVLALAEVQLAHRLRTGAFLALTLDDVMEHGPALLLDWIAGFLPVGAAVALLFGGAAYGCAVHHQRRMRRRLSERRPSRPPPPSSESPP